jgi:hypothetical protein
MKTVREVIEDKLSSEKHNILSKYIDLYFDGECKLTDYVFGSSDPSQIIIFYKYMNGDSYPDESIELSIVDFILFKDMLDRGF